MYMAPEVSLQPGPYDTKADLWSVGIIMFQLLTGEFHYPILLIDVFFKTSFRLPFPLRVDEV